MSAIYEDVIRTESERLEMMVAIYESPDRVRDHDFRTETNTQQPLQSTGSDSVKIRSSRAAVVCLVLLCVLLLTAVIVLCVYNYTNYTNYTQERDELLTNITNLTDERDQLLTNITNFTEERNQLLTNITNLTEERDQLLINNNHQIQLNKQLNQECFNGMDGWSYYNFSFYYISSEKKSWTESRRYCTERGADLIIINIREEQNVVNKMAESATVWIGLTDSEVEGSWKWVDGSNMTSGRENTELKFWRSGEPNGKTTENCAVSYSSGWYDYPCDSVFKWICEKNILK